jgi:1,4-alpha-glucan branching enzyme
MTEQLKPGSAWADVPGGTIEALADARHGDPFGVLGPHETPAGHVVRAFVPGASGIRLITPEGETIAEMTRVEGALFVAPIADGQRYRLAIDWSGTVQETEDTYGFGPLLGPLDLHLFGKGDHRELAKVFGAQAMEVDGVAGVRFAVWAPNARRVSVVGGFNGWDGRRHPMRNRDGVWEIFIPRIGPGEVYKYEILGAEGGLLEKADPVATQTECPPATGSVVGDPAPLRWTDGDWMAGRAARHAHDAPISVYEVHVGSWLRTGPSGGDVDWAHLSERLVPYVKRLGFSHVEMLPIMEYPFGGSWGYQPLGLFAPTARYGTPAEFAGFVDACHAAGIGVILDWVPAHFPTDAHGLMRFDGTALYEHQDAREGFHQDWNTLIYNFGRREVAGFLVASALHWLEHFHIDGLRVDAVASMLYRDYSRKAGEWIPNIYGGRENLEAVAFVKHLNGVVRDRVPGAMVIAEESTAWPGVTAPLERGGLGFQYKWNMGWMHDTLAYMERDPIHRVHHHHEMTFGLVYAFSEHFVLPLSHDEVVHGKGALLTKMPGDRWQQFANLRAYYGFMWGHPGKKLLFMGGEIGQGGEWNHDSVIDWWLTDDPSHKGLQTLVDALNRVYAEERALHCRDSDPGGFQWVIGDDAANSVFAFLRWDPDGKAPVLVVSNMTPVPRAGYRVGVPEAGRWAEVLNTDAAEFGGSGFATGGGADAEAVPAHGLAQSVALTLPPLATVMYRRR